MLAEQAERNKQRIANKEKIQKYEGKKLMSRSPPPKFSSQTVKKEVDANVVDMYKYLGL